MNAVATLETFQISAAPEAEVPEMIHNQGINDSHENAVIVVNLVLEPDADELRSGSDNMLMSLIARGNRPAFEELYDRYVRGCFGLAMKIVREPTMAEEVVQDVFMKIWSQPGIFSPERGRFSGWLLTLVHNRSVDKLRRLKSGGAGSLIPLDGTVDGDVSLADMVPDTSQTPYDRAWSSEQGQIVREAIRALPVQQREAIVLAYFGGLTQKEIAERLQEPLGTIKTRTRSALHHLRRTLGGSGLLGEAR